MGQYRWRGRGGPFSIRLPESVFRPTHTSQFLAEALEIDEGDDVLDVGCGCGVLGLVAARLGAGRIFGVDRSEEAVETARENAASLGLADRARFFVSDLFDALPGGLRADVVIGDVSGIPDALAEATGWYPGGPTGAELPVKMLRAAQERLKPLGRLYLPTGTIQADGSVLEVARELFAKVETVLTKRLPLPADVLRSEGVARLVREGTIRLERVRSRSFWTLSIHRCSSAS